MGPVVLDEDVLPIHPKILKLIDTRVCVTRHWKFDGPEDLVRIRERFTRPTKQPQVHPDQTKLQFLWRIPTSAFPRVPPAKGNRRCLRFQTPDLQLIFKSVVLVAQLVSRHSCVADRLPVVVRFAAGPRVSLKTVDTPRDNGLGRKKEDLMFKSPRGIFNVGRGLKSYSFTF